MHIVSKYECMFEPKASLHRSIYEYDMCIKQKSMRIIYNKERTIAHKYDRRIFSYPLFKLQIFLKLWFFLFIVFLQFLHQQGEVAEQGFCRESEYHHKQYADI